MEQLARELLIVWPDAVPVRLGHHTVYVNDNVVPAHSFKHVVELIDEHRLLELTARDSFDDGLAEFILDRVREVDLPSTDSTKIAVYAVDFPAPWQFHCVVVAPPLLAQRFDHHSDLLKSKTYWAFPAFQGEFKHGDTGKAFWHQIGRKDGWRSDVLRWSRLPKTEKAFD